jgi:serine/threonine protein phosphatase PrpC
VRKITARGLTDVGLKRDHNEDSFICEDGLELYVVCDGMGGHASGEVASDLAVHEVVNLVRDRSHAASTGHVSEALVRDAVSHANERVFVEGMKDAKNEGMGTTLVALFPREDEIVIAHVGDSRVYRLSQRGELAQLTRDHSLLNEKIDAGEITTKEEISTFAHKNVISRALGIRDEVKVDTRRVPRRPGDIFLLCTDGLTDLVDDVDIEAVLEGNRDDLEEALDCLVRMSNARGGKDNITVLAVRVDDEPADDEMARTIQEPPNSAGSSGFESSDHDTETSPAIPQVVQRQSRPLKVRKSKGVIAPVQVQSGAVGCVSNEPPAWANRLGSPRVVITSGLDE